MAQPDQKVKDQIVLRVLQFMFSPENAKRLESLAKADKNPADVVAAQTAMALKIAMDSLAKVTGEPVDPRYILPCGKEIIAHLIDMMVVFRVVPPNQAKGAMAAAFRELVDIVGANQQGVPQQAAPAQQPQMQGA